jgi:hypothetical protein
MQADRSESPVPQEHTEQVLMMLLLSGGQPRWSRSELARELSRPGREPLNITDAINALYGAGLVHVSDDMIEPTHAARYFDQLFGEPI